ncbi:MAG: glycosyltransferase [Bacteroidota bacterium]|nr:glycosyltransferase [Bacteroidota bacterium]
MIERKKNCFLFTQSYPYGEGEIFVGREIVVLSECFNEVVIFPIDCGKEHAKKLPPNVKVVNLFEQGNTGFNRRKVCFNNFSAFLKLIIGEFRSHPKQTLRKFKDVANDNLHQLYRAQILSEYILNEPQQQTVFYSFWFDRWATILGVVKRKIRNLNFITRAHAFDLYEEDNRDGYILNRKFQLENVSEVYSVSKHGAKYLTKLYPFFSQKFKCSYLGTIPHNYINPFNESTDQFIIVSCGSVQKRKRTTSFPEVLSHLPEKFKWIHFGSGPEMNLLRELVEKKGLGKRVELVGHVENEQFLSYLRTNGVSLFLSLSSNEGLPYTMIEAISFGIPLMSTDVGGCGEICNDNTGILIKKDFDPEQVANEILKFKESSKNSLSFRNKVRNYWDDNFNAEKNYRSFYKEISN